LYRPTDFGVAAVFPCCPQSPGFFAFSSTRKAPENEFGPSECWKLKLDVWKIPGIYLRFELRIMLLCMFGRLHTETVTVNIGILGKLFLFSL